MPCRRYECCDACVNAEIPYECQCCDNGSNYEGIDTSEELSVHELRFMTLDDATT